MDLPWLQLLAVLVGGGAAGAIITLVVTSYRARIQPVGRRSEMLPVFRPTYGTSALQTQIAITDGQHISKFENLFIADVQVMNKGNRDLERFPFGITLGPGDKCIYVECLPPDRFHRVPPATPVTPNTPQHELDFVAEPFNRRDSYRVKLYLVVPTGATEPKQLTLGSSLPVRFTDMPTGGELLAEFAAGTILRLGPFRVGLSG